MSKFRKKPVEIEAIQLVQTKESITEVIKFIGQDNATRLDGNGVTIKTLEGDHLASWNDYVIKGIKGEFYPCKPDIFKATYVTVNSGTITNLTFGEALEYVKQGKYIARENWNGKNQFVYMITSDELSSSLSYGYGEYSGEPRFTSCLAIKTTRNDIQVGWLASQSDMLSNDWYVVL